MKKFLTLVVTAILAISCLFGLTACQPKKDVLKVIDIALNQEEYAFAVTKDNADLLNSLNNYMTKIKGNGVFDNIVSKYQNDESGKVGIALGVGTPSANDLVVLTNTPFEPFEYVGTDGLYYGIDMEIMKGFAEDIDKNLFLVEHLDFDTICNQANQYPNAIVAAGLTYEASRALIVDFSQTYYEANQVVIARADDTTFDNCTTAEEVIDILMGLTAETKIGYQNGTTGQLFVDGDEDWGFTKLPVTGQGYKTAALASQDVINKNIDYVIVDASPAKAIVKALNKLNK